MSRPQPNKPNPAIQRLYREAEEAWGQQDYQKSISLIEQATRKEPYNPILLLDLARACGRRYDFPAAERYIEKAVQISRDRAHTLGEAGRICLEFDDFDMAIGCLERASQKKGVSIGALVTLADIYIRDKRLEEAAGLVARAAQMDRKDPRVLLEDRPPGGRGGEAPLPRVRRGHPAQRAAQRGAVARQARHPVRRASRVQGRRARLHSRGARGARSRRQPREVTAQ